MTRRPRVQPPDRLAPLSVAALAAVLLLLTAASLRKIWGADFWWQYATGQLVANEGIPHADTFSYTVAGAPWIEVRWLYCYGLYHATRWIGLEGLVVAKWLALATAFLFVTLPRFSRRSATPAAAVLAVAILASSQRFFLRPELVTYVLFALFLWIIDRFRSRGGARLLFVLPVLQILWVNSHTLFVFGPLLTGLLAAVTGAGLLFRPPRGKAERREKRRRAVSAGLVFGLTTLACFANPYGLEGVLFPLRLFEEIRGTVFKESIGEFRSPFSFSHSFPAVAYYEVLVAICAVLAILNWKRLDPFWTILVAAQLYLSALAIRNLPLFALAAVPFVLDNLRTSSLPGRWVQRLPGAEAIGAAAVIVACVGYTWDLSTNRFHARSGGTNQFGLGLASHRFPIGAVDFLEKNGFDGRIFHTMRDGAYLAARGREVFIDPRLEVYGESHFATYLNAVNAGPTWGAILRSHRCDAALLAHDSPLVESLAASEEWGLAYFDEVTALFTRRESSRLPEFRTGEAFLEAVAAIRRRLPEKAPGEKAGWLERAESPTPYRNVASFLMTAGRPELALPFFADVVTIDPDDVDAYRSCASLHGFLGNAARATEMLEEGLRRWPGDPWMQRELGAHRFNAGRTDEARVLAENSLRGDPTDPSAWELLAMAHARQGDFPGAVEAARRAVDLDPDNPRTRESLESYRRSLGSSP